MKTKLHRAVDATLEQYGHYLDNALDGVDCFPRFNTRYCWFCDYYRNSTDTWCETCPIKITEADVGWAVHGCENLCCSARWVFNEVGAVPAILAAMIYLHGFVEE